MKIGILEPKDFSPEAMNVLQHLGALEIFDGQDKEQFLSDKVVLFVRLAYRIDARFLDQAPNLRFLVSPTTGLTHIDLDEAAQRSVTIL